MALPSPTTSGGNDAGASRAAEAADGQSVEDHFRCDPRRHARFLRFLSDRLCPRLPRRALEADLPRVRDDPARRRHRRDPRRLLLGMDGRPDRAAEGVCRHGAELLAATGLMAASPDQYGWVFLAFCRLLVGIGVAGMVTVDLPLVQEFVPSSNRGFVGGIVTSTISVGGALGGAAGTYLGPTIGWRGLFLLGLLPALMTLLIRAWVPESPRWLIRRGRPEEARRSIAWALQSDPNKIELPARLPVLQHTPWRELFKYPRSVALVCLIGLSQTSGVGLALWGPTLLLLLLKTTPSEAAFLMMWVGVSAFVGRVFSAFLPDLIGRRVSGCLMCLGGVVTLVIAGYYANAFIGTVSVFWLMLMAHSFFGGGSYTIIAPYMAEVWPAGLRASGMGLGYGVGNCGKIISPLGLALIVGGTNFIKPEASVG